jgi:DNA polymerase III alpha subunit
MMTIPNLDSYDRQVYTEQDAVNLLYTNPNVDLRSISIQDVEQFNHACEMLYTGYKLEKTADLASTPAEYHKLNQQNWHMPVEYKDLDIAKWCLERCDNEEQLQRTGKELIMYQERDMFPLLQFLKYMVDTMREKNIVWGVGRGSSVSSYVLYLIGVHKIDAIYYNLEVEDFLR